MNNTVIAPYSFSAAVRRLGLIDHVWQHMGVVVAIPPEHDNNVPEAAVLVANAISRDGLSTRKLRWVSDIDLSEEGGESFWGESFSVFAVEDRLPTPDPETALPFIEQIGKIMQADAKISVFLNADFLRGILEGMNGSSISLELLQGNKKGLPWCLVRVFDGQNTGILAPESRGGVTGFNRTTPLVMGHDASFQKPRGPWILFGDKENDPKHEQDCYFAIPLRANEDDRRDVFRGKWCARLRTWLRGENEDEKPMILGPGIPHKLGVEILYCDASVFENCLDAYSDLNFGADDADS